jgi:hypothetical protein
MPWSSRFPPHEHDPRVGNFPATSSPREILQSGTAKQLKTPTAFHVHFCAGKQIELPTKPLNEPSKPSAVHSDCRSRVRVDRLSDIGSDFSTAQQIGISTSTITF